MSSLHPWGQVGAVRYSPLATRTVQFTPPRFAIGPIPNTGPLPVPVPEIIVVQAGTRIVPGNNAVIVYQPGMAGQIRPGNLFYLASSNVAVPPVGNLPVISNRSGEPAQSVVLPTQGAWLEVAGPNVWLATPGGGVVTSSLTISGIAGAPYRVGVYGTEGRLGCPHPGMVGQDTGTLAAACVCEPHWYTNWWWAIIGGAAGWVATKYGDDIVDSLGKRRRRR